MKIYQFLNETKTTLSALYKDGLPDRDEQFWDEVTRSDLDIPLEIKKIAPYKLGIILTSQYRAEHIDELVLKGEQKRVVNQYKKDPNLSDSIIVMSDGRIIDGNHRALAAYLTKRPINYIDLSELADEQSVAEGENWSKHNNKRAGGMSKKSVASYRRSHPGSKIQTAVTTKPSKLKKGSKAAARRKSFCARMRGMKKHRTGAKTANDPNSNINKSLRRWHCESIEELNELVLLAEAWSQKYKSSINCSHPKGFSQKAHCAGKKKHNESIEMEMVCEDCGMCETHGDHTSDTLDEACWKGYHKEGNKKMFGKTYPNCVKNEDIDEDLSRRGFLRGLGAAAVAGAAGSAMAQSRPVDVSREFQNMRQDDPRVQHNKDIEEMARSIYEQIVATRGQPIDRRQQQMWMTIAREKATEKLSKYAPGRPAPQSQSSGSPAQGSERRVSRNIDNFESQGVAEEQHSCPHCGGEMVSEELMNEKKDACYYKVKSRYKVWPSAYASGALVKCRKSGADSWGNGGKKNESSILEGIEQADESLHDWFNKEKWVRMDTKGNIKGPCAREPGEGKPKCLPQSKAHSLGKKGRASAAARKRREDPNPDRRGSAINVNTKRKTNEVSDERLPT